MSDKKCRFCGDELSDENWTPSCQKTYNYICRECHNEQVRLWRKANPEKSMANSIRQRRKQGQLSMSDNKDCSQFLGIHIAESVLINSFNDVEVMPMHNPGYDFKCNKGMLIDGKSSCQRKNGSWMFNINRNVIADYFVCIAFDNRMDLNTLHAWLIPGDKINHLAGLRISPSTIHKWDKYERDITKISACCDIMKNGVD